MLSFVQLDKPHIDIELYGTDTNIAPIDKVHIMDEDSFEQFMHFTELSGRHSVLERPLSEVNGRLFFS